jgi:hypothetical protein
MLRFIDIELEMGIWMLALALVSVDLTKLVGQRMTDWAEFKLHGMI